MPFSNSYIFKSDLGPKFKNQLEAVVDQFMYQGRLAWWDRNPHPLHMTIASGDGKKLKSKTVETQQIIEKRNERLIKGIRELFATCNQSLFMLPSNIRISDTGFILLEFVPAPLEGEDTKKLQEIHERFVMMGLTEELSINLDFCFQKFQPHVSIGKVKTNSGLKYPTAQEVKAARENLALHKNAILKELLDPNKVRILNLFNFSVVYSLPIDDSFHAFRKAKGKEWLLGKHEIPPRNFGVSKVTATDNNYTLHFKKIEDAKRCSHFMFQMGIFSNEKNTISPKTIGSENTLLLSLVEYSKIAGVIDKCYPSIKPIPGGHVTKSSAFGYVDISSENNNSSSIERKVSKDKDNSSRATNEPLLFSKSSKNIAQNSVERKISKDEATLHSVCETLYSSLYPVMRNADTTLIGDYLKNWKKDKDSNIAVMRMILDNTTFNSAVFQNTLKQLTEIANNPENQPLLTRVADKLSSFGIVSLRQSLDSIPSKLSVYS